MLPLSFLSSPSLFLLLGVWVLGAPLALVAASRRQPADAVEPLPCDPWSRFSGQPAADDAHVERGARVCR